MVSEGLENGCVIFHTYTEHPGGRSVYWRLLFTSCKTEKKNTEGTRPR